MKHATVEFTMKWGTLLIITEAKTDMVEIRLLVQQMSYMLRCQGQETHVILQSTTIMHAGSVYDKDRCAECANKFIQYKDANMMSSGVEIKICSVPGNHNQGTQTIMLYATKPDMLLEMSTKFMKDHSQFMVKKEQDARQVIHKFYLSIKREDWTLDTMRDLYETVITNYNNTRNEVAWIYEGMQEMGSKVTDMPGNKSNWITEEMHKMVFTVSVMPGNMDQHGRCKNRVAWISGGTDKIDSTVSVVPGSMDQRGGGVTKRKYDISSVRPEDGRSMRKPL